MPVRALIMNGVFLALTTAMAPAIAAQGPSQQETNTPNWKDRQEYDLFLKMSQTTDPKGRLALLKSWQDKYPQSDVAELRLEYYVATLATLAQAEPGERQPLLDSCEALLKVDPKNAEALYQVALWGPVIGAASPLPELLSEVDAAAKGFLNEADTAFVPAKKPNGLSDREFAQAKSFRLAVAHNALAWEATVKKDLPVAEAEYKTSLTINPDQGAAAAQYARVLYEQKKYPAALFEFARAAQYTGPGPALPPASRSQMMDFFQKAYKDFHGGIDGSVQVLAEAKSNALPPANFSMESTADIAEKAAKALKDRMASDPAFALWYTIRENLTTDQGDAFFEKSLKGALVPGEAQGVHSFSGAVISLDPPDRPTRVLIGVSDPSTPDATLEFSKLLSGAFVERIKPGEKLEFEGVVSSYSKDPYMLILKDPKIRGPEASAPTRAR